MVRLSITVFVQKKDLIFYLFFFYLEKEKAPQTWTVFFPCGNALMCSLGLSYRRLEDIRVFED